jgi:hypothetical protein
VPRADVSAGELQGNNGYADIFAGVSLYYNLDLKPKTEFAAPPPAAATAPAPAAAPSAAP